ncbi:MAG: COG4705 family protein [Candidatus Acidiferrales bacterium]
MSKVPQATLAFWAVKILATTVGETGGDALSMTLNLGYAVSSLIFLGFFCVTLAAQMTAKRFHPLFYWAVVVATTTVGTTTSDYLDRTVGLGYVKSSILLSCALIAVLIAWHFSTGQIAVDQITTRKNELFYWVTILVSNTLGTALGDFVATTTGLGFERGALVFAALIAVVAAAYFFTKIPHSVLFWAAYSLTRPLGATLGDTLTKPHDEGGLALGRIASSLAIAGAMVVVVALTSRREREHAA